MTAAPVPRPAAITGYVEAMTPAGALGWVWCPDNPALRLRVEAWHGEHLLASVIADRPRADLAGAGIGDGAHAFEFSIPADAAPRLDEIRILAIGADGEKVPIGAPPPPQALADRLDKMVRALDMLVGSQRLLHRNLQAALLRPPEPSPDAAAQEQSELAKRLDGLETLVLRLDAHLAELARPDSAPSAGARSWILAAIAASFAALLLSAWGLLRALPG